MSVSIAVLFGVGDVFELNGFDIGDFQGVLLSIKRSVTQVAAFFLLFFVIGFKRLSHPVLRGRDVVRLVFLVVNPVFEQAGFEAVFNMGELCVARAVDEFVGVVFEIVKFGRPIGVVRVFVAFGSHHGATADFAKCGISNDCGGIFE